MVNNGDVSSRADRGDSPSEAVRRGRSVGKDPAARRESIVDAMVAVIAEHGYAGTSISLVCAEAKISRSTFYELFPSFEECFLAVLDRGMETMASVMRQAFTSHSHSDGHGEGRGGWLDRMLATEAAVLSFLDSEPEFARVLLVDALGVGSWALGRRQDNVGALRDLIVEEFKDTPLGGDFPPLAASGVMASLLGIMHEHLLHRESAPLISLLGPLMGVITTPYLPAEDVAREIRRGEQLAEQIRRAQDDAPGPAAQSGGLDSEPAALEIPELLHNPQAQRARLCLRYLAEQGELGLNPNNRQIAAGVGITHKGQISKLLGRLEAEGILSKVAHGPGRPNAWRLTPYGRKIAAHFQPHESG